jgi:large subunit ribosomal protein L10
MTKEEKSVVIEQLTHKFKEYNYFYVTDTSALTVDEINKFRKFCFEKGVEYKVIKNSLIFKALQSLSTDYSEFREKVLVGASGLIFSHTGNLPAKLLKEFKQKTNIDKIKFKGASVDSSIYIGADTLDTLATLKSKNELIAEVIGLLQSPAKNVVSALKSGENKLAGLVKAIQEKKEAAA